MKRLIIIFCTAAALTLAGCDNGSMNPERLDIRFSAGLGDGTRALLESDQIKRVGNTVVVYGMATDADNSNPVSIPGKIGAATGETHLEDGQPLVFGAEGWTFNNGGEVYKWAPSTNYRFFGWLDTDASAETDLKAETFFGTGFTFDDATGVLTIPPKTMGINENNFDFAYSDVVVRTAASADFSDVVLPLHHLFASFSISARNYTTSDIYLENVKLHGLYDDKSATVTFGSAATTVSYTGGSRMSTVELVTGGQIHLAVAGQNGDSKANIAQGASDRRKDFLVWPQTIKEMDPSVPFAEIGWTPAGTDPYLEIVYRQGSPSNDPITARLPYPTDADGWGAGVHRAMELSFADKKITLNVLAADWDKQTPVIDYNGAVAVTQTLRVAGGYEDWCILSETGDIAYFKPGFPIVLEFTVDQPANSTWIVTRQGDFDAIEIDNFTAEDSSVIGDGEDSGEGLITTGSVSKLALYPKITELQKSEYVIQLSFSVRLNSGEMTNIDKLIFNDKVTEGNPVISPKTFILLK